LITAAGGKNSALGKSLRAGLIDSIADDVIKRSRGAKAIAPDILTNVLDNMEKKGLLKFLTRTDVETLADLNKLAPFLKAKADTGTSIQAAEAASGARGTITDVITGQGFGGAATQTILEHMGIGKLFTSSFGKWLLRGSGKKVVSNRNITARALAALSQMTADFDNIDPQDYESLLTIDAQAQLSTR